MDDTCVRYGEKERRWHTGTTRDLRARDAAHTKGHVWSIQSRRPASLVYDEACRCQDDAFRRERSPNTRRGQQDLRPRLGVALILLSRNKLAGH